MTKTHHLKSVFERISEIAFAVKTQQQLEVAKATIVKFVDETKVKEQDKVMMKKNINEAKNILSFQRYIANALLKFEGLGLAQLNKTSKDAPENDKTTEEESI